MASVASSPVPATPGPLGENGANVPPLTLLASSVGGWVKKAAEKTVAALKPSGLLVPGGAPAVSASVKAAEAVGAAGTAAADGIKRGFSMFVFVALGVVALVIYRQIKG